MARSTYLLPHTIGKRRVIAFQWCMALLWHIFLAIITFASICDNFTCLSYKRNWEALISTESSIFTALWLFNYFFLFFEYEPAVTSLIWSSLDQLGAALWSFHTNKFDAAKAVTAGFSGNGSRILRSQLSIVLQQV